MSEPSLLTPARRRRRRARRVAILVLTLALIAVATGLIVWLTSSAAPTVGYDISAPQCSGSYPASPLFGIVGVNGGLANNANPCLRDELRWARSAPGQKHPQQPPLSLYLVTANPGGHHVADWPSSGTTPTYGACNGLLTNACSYLYGEQRAAHSYALAAALDPAAARTVPWWLDVELGATWAGTYELNIAALKGFLAGLHDAGATGPVGIYSTSAQWNDITGLTAETTPAAFGRHLPDWAAGAETTTLTQAWTNCAGRGFTGRAPALAQYRNGAFDGELRCSATH
ncbi:MAG TPA: hypothetical protein VGH79_08370 [Gaiellaceae bacterium]